jgi:hypothetical protein
MAIRRITLEDLNDKELNELLVQEGVIDNIFNAFTDKPRTGGVEKVNYGDTKELNKPSLSARYSPSYSGTSTFDKRASMKDIKDKNPDLFDDVETPPDPAVTKKDKPAAPKKNFDVNIKTLFSKDFSTICPKMLYGVECPYCYVKDSRGVRCNAKRLSIYKPFDDELLQLSDTEIRVLNYIGGIRLFSFGDYIAGPRPKKDANGAYGIEDVRSGYDDDIINFLNACMKTGVMCKVITKQPEFIKKFHSHPAISVINISIDNVATIADKTRQTFLSRIGLQKPTTEKQFQVYGANWGTAMSLRDKYPKVRIRSVCMNVEDIMNMYEISDVMTLNHGKSLEKLRSVETDEEGKTKMYEEDTPISEVTWEVIEDGYENAVRDGVITKDVNGDDLYKGQKILDVKLGKRFSTVQILLPPKKRVLIGFPEKPRKKEVELTDALRKKIVTKDGEEYLPFNVGDTELVSVGDDKKIAQSSSKEVLCKIIDKKDKVIDSVKIQKVAKKGTPIFKRYDDAEFGAGRGELITTKTSDETTNAPIGHTKGALDAYRKSKKIGNNPIVKKARKILGLESARQQCFEKLSSAFLLEEKEISNFSHHVFKRIGEAALEYSRLAAMGLSNQEIKDAMNKDVYLLTQEDGDKKSLPAELFKNLANKLCCVGAKCEYCTNYCGADQTFLSNSLAEMLEKREDFDYPCDFSEYQRRIYEESGTPIMDKAKALYQLYIAKPISSIKKAFGFNESRRGIRDLLTEDPDSFRNINNTWVSYRGDLKNVSIVVGRNFDTIFYSFLAPKDAEMQCRYYYNYKETPDDPQSYKYITCYKHVFVLYDIKTSSVIGEYIGYSQNPFSSHYVMKEFLKAMHNKKGYDEIDELNLTFVGTSPPPLQIVKEAPREVWDNVHYIYDGIDYGARIFVDEKTISFWTSNKPHGVKMLKPIINTYNKICRLYNLSGIIDSKDWLIDFGKKHSKDMENLGQMLNSKYGPTLNNSFNQAQTDAEEFRKNRQLNSPSQGTSLNKANNLSFSLSKLKKPEIVDAIKSLNFKYIDIIKTISYLATMQVGYMKVAEVIYKLVSEYVQSTDATEQVKLKDEIDKFFEDFIKNNKTLNIRTEGKNKKFSALLDK